MAGGFLSEEKERGKRGGGWHLNRKKEGSCAHGEKKEGKGRGGFFCCLKRGGVCCEEREREKRGSSIKN